jgi:hypothetical protein
MMKHLSQDEQRILLLVERRRARSWRGGERPRLLRNAVSHGLLMVACIGGLVVADVATAAEARPAVSAPMLFNEANAAQRAGRLGPAILDYERARLLAPRDTAIARNLSVARQKAGVTAPAVPMWQRPAEWLSFDSLAGLASISLLLFSLLFFGTRLIPTTLRGLSRGVATSLGAVALIAATAVAVRWPELNRAVITGSHAHALIAPANSAAVSFNLPQGEIVSAERQYGQFVLVRVADGRSGWVTDAEAERIIPAGSLAGASIDSTSAAIPSSL